MLNPELYFKDNLHLIEQGNAKLPSSVLTTINGNITLPACGKSIITNYKNTVSFSFKDDDFPPLLYRSVGNNVCNPTSNIMKTVHTKKFNVRRRAGTSHLCNNTVCVRNVNVGCNRIIIIVASNSHNFNVNVQHVGFSSCGRPHNDSFENVDSGVQFNNKQNK